MKRNAFTLLEVLVAMGVFLALAGGIFVSVSTVTRAAAEVAAVRSESERLDAFEALVRHAFLNLPAAAQMALSIRSGAQGDRVVLLLDPPPPELGSSGATALSAVPDGRGAFALTLESIDRNTGSAMRSIPLLPDVRSLQWRFAGSDGTFRTEWSRSSGRPLLVRLDLVTTGGSERQWEFLLPALGSGNRRAANP